MKTPDLPLLNCRYPDGIRVERGYCTPNTPPLIIRQIEMTKEAYRSSPTRQIRRDWDGTHRLRAVTTSTQQFGHPGVYANEMVAVFLTDSTEHTLPVARNTARC